MSRQPQPPGQPPVSFRTVPGRNRTQKWNQAKTYNYDGDDWGGYDPYEEYGAPADGQSLPSQAGQSSSAQNPRSNRANSFDLGEERRAFSAGQPATYEEDRNGSMLVSSQRLNEYGRPRDFTNPEQVPRPLNTQVSPNRAGPASSTGVDTTQQTDSSVPAVTEKPLPFIRPSDIYKRMNEEKERERQSLDSSRPSIDSVQRGDSSSPPLRQISGNESDSAAMLLRMKPSLEPVVEQRETLIESVQSSQPFESNGAQYSARKLPGSSESQQKVSSNTPPTSLQPAEETVQTLRPVPPPVSRFSGLGTVDGYTGVESSGSREPLGTAETTASKVPGAPVEAQSGLSLSDNGQSNNGAAAGLQHQPSMGYKSVVNTAFDRSDDISVPPTPSSRNEPQAIDSSGMVRSDTTSTAGISPIMSRVPSAATAQQRVHERELHIPPVIEEPYKSYTPALLASTTYQTPLSTTTGHSKNASNELPANVQPGYRRSLDPPSNGSSPARTPGLEDTSSRRLSTPMAAETIDTTERTDVIDQTADVTNAYSKPTDARMTEHEESRQEAVDEYAKALPIGRGRSGTNYSLREADLARTINASPEDVSYSAAVAEAERATREQFLREHASNPGTPSSASFGPKSPGAYPAGLGIVRTSTPNSAKGRVKEIADKYHEIHEAARRDSQTSVVSTKSSWSNFRGSEENLLSPVAGRTLRRTNTGSQLALSTSPEQEHDEAVFDSPDKMFPEYDNSGDRAAQGDDAPHDHTRSENQQTFRPSMPGGWISAAPTPSDEKSQEIELHTAHSHYNGGSGEPATPRASHMQGDEEAGEGIDLTPTTKKEPLRTSNDINFVTPSSEISNLGPEASSSSAVPDFSANQYTASGVKNIHAEQARDAGAALGANLMSNAGLTSQSRDFAVRDSAPVQQPEMDPHPAIGDVYGISKLHIPPPLERGDSFATEGTASTASLSPQKEILDDGQENRKPGDVYFPNSSSLEPLAPLAFRKGSRLDGAADEIATAPERHPMMKSAFSADSINVCDNNGDSESDRLRREIVRSLDPIRSHDSHQQENSAHVEGNENNGTSRDVALSTEEPSHTLNQRFSWERPYEPPGPISAASTVPVPRIAEPEQGPEAASEMPHEHPRSHDLHVVNTGNFDSLASPVDQQSFKDKALPPLVPPISRSVSPLNDSQNALTPGGTKQRQDGMTEMAPSPISERHGSDADSVSHRLPSYYFSGSDVLGLGAVGAVGAAATTAAVDGDSKSARDTEAVSSNGGITENPLPAIPSTTGKDASSPRATVSHAGPESPRIPPFREILAVKSAPQRIEAYITTRQTFATMETGLDNWLRSMMAQHPEHAELASMPQSSYKAITPLQSSSTFRVGHRKASPSLARFTSLATGVGGNGERKVSGIGEEAAETSSPGGAVGAELQQRSKELLKNAGVLGGKAQAGAKGLFAKGKSRFGRKDGDAKATTTLARAPLSSQHFNSMYTDVCPRPLDDTANFQNTTTHPQAHAVDLVSPQELSRSISMQSSTANLNTALADATKGLNLPSKTRVNRLSNTFARLRTRSPSASTSRSSNRSTPSSVLLTSLTHMPDLESHAGVDSAAEPRDSISKGLKLTGLDIRHSGNDDDSIANTQAVNEKTEYRPPLSAAATNRKEAWQTSDDSFKTPRFNDERVDPSLQRLGVLPSPGKDSSSFTGEFLGQNKTYHGTKDLAEDENIEQSSSNCDMSLAFNLDHLSGDRIKNVSSNVHVRFETANIAGVENMPDTALPSAYEQSVQETIFNGRTSLPSQRRLSAQGPPTPTNALGFWRRSIGNVEILNEHEPTGLASEEAHAQAAASEVSKARTQLGPHDRAAHEHEGSVLCLSHATNNPEPSVKCPTSLDIASDDQNLDSPPTLLKSQDRADESEISEESLLESKVRHLTLGLSFDRDIETRDKSDLESRRSSVSSLDHSIEDHEKGWMFQKQQHEGSQEPPQTLVSVALAVPHAPRSALSANVFQNNNELAGVQKDDNAATVSPVQPSSHLHTVPSDFPQFMARSHHGPVASDERPMSYLPLPRDSSGYPMAETIDTVQAGLSVSPLVDLSVFSGPPPGTPPFLQHPAFRQPSPGFVRSEFSKKKTVQSAEKASDSMINSKEVAAEENAPPVQLSNLVQTPDGPVEWKDGVARRQTTLIAPDRANVLQSEAELVPVSRVLQRDLQPGKRISGLWDSFKRSSMAFKDDTRDDDHEKSGPWKHTAASKVREPINAPNTLKKKHSQRVPQKSDSATVPPTEPRKKRFSGISSLFNRSNVTAAKPVKLTKPDQREKDNARHGNNGPNKSNNASVTGMISGYESYEAMRRQQIRDFSTGYPGAELQLPQLNKELPPPPRASSMPLQQANDPAKTSTELTTSAQRYSEISSSTANRTENHDHGAAQFSNLPGPANIKSLSLLPHGVLKPNATRHLSLDTIIPQAFMPTEASYGERIKAVGPPPNGSTAQTYLHTARDKAVTPSPAPWNYENFASTRTTYNGMETRHYPMSQQAMDPVSPPTPYDHSQPRHSISPVRPARITRGYGMTDREGVNVVDYASNRNFEQQALNMQPPSLQYDDQHLSHNDKHCSWYMEKEAVPDVQQSSYYTPPAHTHIPMYGLRPAPYGGGRQSMPPQLSTYHYPNFRSRSIPWENNAPPMPHSHLQAPVQSQYYQQHDPSRYYSSNLQRDIRPSNNENDAPISLADHNDRITNEGAAMRGSSYPGQEWVPSQGRDETWR